jgi:hypothetical protein
MLGRTQFELDVISVAKRQYTDSQISKTFDLAVEDASFISRC